MKIILSITAFAALGLGIATAGSNNYSVNLDQKVWVGDKELKPGDYKVTVNGDKATLKSGKTVVEVPAKVEASPNKYTVSTIDTKTEGGKSMLREIHVGGSTTRIILEGDKSTAHGE